MNNLTAFTYYDKLESKWKTCITANEEEFRKLLQYNPNIGARLSVSVQLLVDQWASLDEMNKVQS